MNNNLPVAAFGNKCFKVLSTSALLSSSGQTKEGGNRTNSALCNGCPHTVLPVFGSPAASYLKYVS
eukprot:766783-Hanusia_phi.AAC.2